MNAGMIFVNILAIILIALVGWWFFWPRLRSDHAVKLPAVILVKDGIYQPALIQIPANKPVTLQFLREDETACAATVVFPQLNVSFDLPKGKVVKVSLPAQPKGTLDFTCSMGMYRGKLVAS